MMPFTCSWFSGKINLACHLLDRRFGFQTRSVQESVENLRGCFYHAGI